ncbi:phosphoglycolate phosphatase [Prauserella shujinwangii]|uniref:Phosphoglycolate phosphatase n=1 Tax=Prauserella shujinwangii TaxID=1453103 RepID=A0A2T0M2C0_9PSEU|nr:HAD family hydrolase [Prauserella shujinwangii]PRX50901.1 phosphoglycolate phosphatase [Prauserella shujinwangii]
MPDTAIFDVDGTLVDSNYQHALAWFRAFRRYGITLPLWDLHRAIGMGGDRLVGHVAGDDVERKCGDRVRDAHTEEFDRLIDEVRPLPQAREILRDVRDRGFRLVLATSGEPRHVAHLLSLLDGDDLAHGRVTSDDVTRTKPEADLVDAALREVGGRSGVLIGDSPWDCQAAAKRGVPTLAVRTGGFSVDELAAAGADAVFESLPDLRAALDDTVLARPGDR